MERPPGIDIPPPPSFSRKPTILDRVFRRLPPGSRQVIGAVALGAMEAISSRIEDDGFQAVEAASQAQEFVQEEKEDRLKREREAQTSIDQTRVEEIRRRIQNG